MTRMPDAETSMIGPSSQVKAPHFMRPCRRFSLAGGRSGVPEGSQWGCIPHAIVRNPADLDRIRAVPGSVSGLRERPCESPARPIIRRMFSPIPEILDELRAGRMVVLTDDEDRENEGDLVLPAQFASPEAIGFMLTAARGYMCLSLTEADCRRLDLQPQGGANTSVRGTAFTVAIDGHPRLGFTTGVSAPERTRTIKLAIDPSSRPDDFVRPGHINPLRSRDGGVLVRTGQTEGSVDLCRLAGLYPAAVIIEILREDGEMARVPDLAVFCRKHSLKMCSVAQIIEHRLARESLVRRLAPERGTPVRTAYGEFNLIAFQSLVDPWPQIALTAGGVGELDGAGAVMPSPGPTLVRVHRQSLMGDVFGALSSSPEGPTGETLHAAMRRILKDGRGAVLYLRHEGVGDPLDQRLGTIRRPAYQSGADSSHLTDTAPAGAAVSMQYRDLGIGSQMLRQLGVTRLRLLTNHQADLPGLEGFGLEVVERVKIE
jgi:3,4-dihydroxy 2-butanone 4-phosphate synthase/GTP cyclohydrolase II